jgi:LmbE family N-acetylglucosaminyl deacetylase
MTRAPDRILVLSPHPDDGEISAGGTIARLAEEGHEIHYVAFSSCEKSLQPGDPVDILKQECHLATGQLGIPAEHLLLLDFEVREFPRLRQEILDRMIHIGREVQPDLVITPSSFDTHQDHQVIYHETIRAFKKISSIWGMEHPWNNISFRTDIFMALEARHLEQKIRALAQYNSQSYRPYFSPEYVRSSAYTRGMNVGVDFAEVFECIRMLY